jgi:hypothetical protein
MRSRARHAGRAQAEHVDDMTGALVLIGVFLLVALGLRAVRFWPTSAPEAHEFDDRLLERGAPGDR